MPQYKGLPQGAKPLYQGLPPGARIVNQPQPSAEPQTSAFSVTAPSSMPDISFISLESEDKNYTSRVMDDMRSRYSKMQEIYNRTQGVDFRPGAQTLGQVNIAGQAAGMLWDPVEEGIISAWNTLAPDEFKEFISEQMGDFAQTELGKMSINALSKGVESFKQINDKIPEIGETFESLLNFSLVKLETAMARHAKHTLSDAGSLIARAEHGITPEARAISSSFLDRRMSKGIRDTLPKIVDIAGEGKRTFKQKISYLNRAEAAIRDIVDNRSAYTLTDLNGKTLSHKLPVKSKSAFLDTLQVIEQRKRLIGPDIETAIKAADATGQKVKFTSVINNLEKFITSPSIVSRPDTDALQKAGRKLIKYYTQLGEAKPSFVYNNLIKDRNRLMAEIKGFLQPTLSDTEKAALYAAELDGLNTPFRRILNSSGDAALKKYSNLLTIEGDIQRMVHTKAASAGIDYAQAYGATEAARFLVGAPESPSTLGMAHVWQRITRRLPEQRLANMFRDAEKIANRQVTQANPFQSKSTIGRALTGP